MFENLFALITESLGVYSKVDPALPAAIIDLSGRGTNAHSQLIQLASLDLAVVDYRKRFVLANIVVYSDVVSRGDIIRLGSGPSK